MLLSNGETLQLCPGPRDSAWTRVPVTIPARGVLEKHRFVCYDGVGLALWPEEHGLFQLRGKTHLSTARIAPEGERFPIKWDFPVAWLRIEPANLTEHNAMDFLRRRMTEYYEMGNPGTYMAPHVFRIRLFKEFVDRYPDCAYVPEIRWELVRLLKAEVDDQHGPLHGDPGMLKLLEECLTVSLDRGGAYSEGFCLGIQTAETTRL